jgi:hypothetical protein
VIGCSTTPYLIEANKITMAEELEGKCPKFDVSTDGFFLKTEWD